MSFAEDTYTRQKKESISFVLLSLNRIFATLNDFIMAEAKNTNRNRARKTAAPIDNTYGHMPPQALDIERVVLGALITQSNISTPRAIPPSK